MTRDEGKDLLNKIKEGHTFEYEQITAALIATGDLAGWRETHLVGSLETGMRSAGLDQAIQRNVQHERALRSRSMVGKDQTGHCQDQGSQWSGFAAV